MAAKIITIAIEKGGSGKTVTASNLAYLMGDEGKKVLCVDTDPQGNLTFALSGGNTMVRLPCGSVSTHKTFFPSSPIK